MAVSSIISQTLSKGNIGREVQKLQGYLHILGYLSKSDIKGVNGVYTFGPKTEAAVKDVQHKYNQANGKNIPENGKADFFTRTVVEWVSNATPKRGSTGSLVESSSNYLLWAGLLPTVKSTLDAEMEQAINKFQSAHGLYQTGTLNTKTVTKLVSAQLRKIRAEQQKIIVREVMNGEVNHETKPVFGTGALLMGAGIFLWWINKKKVVVG